MVNFEFGGEPDVLSEKQIKFVSNILENHGYEGSKVIIETLGKAGDNYSANVKTFTVVRDDGKTLKIIAKIAPTSEHLRSMLAVDCMFQNEIIMYEKVLPTFRELEIAADIPEENRLKYPICYGIFTEKPHEIILLEDMKQNNYTMLDRLKSLTDEAVRVILDSFAKLHALSYVLKDKNPTKYKDLTSKFIDFYTSPQMKENVKHFSMMEENIISLLDSESHKNKFRGSIGNLMDEAHKLTKCDKGSRYSVIIHGDSWTNNILFKLGGMNSKPQECILIDYQLSVEKSPVSDLLYLIFSCTDFETRSKYYNDWMDLYHENLDNYLSLYGIKANYVYPKEKMLADLKRHAKFYLGWSMILQNVLCMGTEDAARLKDAMESTASVEEMMDTIKTDNINTNAASFMKSRLQGILNSYYELGYCS